MKPLRFFQPWTVLLIVLTFLTALGAPALGVPTPGVASLAAAGQQSPETPPVVDQDDEVQHRQAIILAPAVTPKPAFLYSASSQAQVTVKQDLVQQTIHVAFRVVQGKPGTIRLQLKGPGKVNDVQGDGIVSWSVRTQGENRFLEMEIQKDAKSPTAIIQLETEGNQPQRNIPHLAPGDAVGFDSQLRIHYEKGLAGKVVVAEGFVRLNAPEETQHLQTATGGQLTLETIRRGAIPQPVELSDVKLVGQMDPDSQSVGFVLQGTATVYRAGARLKVLQGNLALEELPGNENYQVHLSVQDGRNDYELVFPNTGTFPIQLQLVAALLKPQPNWQAIDFSVVANAVVPVSLNGLDSELDFARNTDSVVPIWDGQQWQAFLPASGHMNLQWTNARNSAEGKLFFATTARIETTVGPGLLRQDHLLEFQVLQGQLKSLSIQMVGPGEILDVQGANVVGWKVTGENENRQLEITLSQPIQGQSQFQIRSQTPLGSFPVKVEGLSLNPNGAIRHSGHLRISNTGSVRLTPTDLKGLTQLAPEHYPGNPLEARQLFVYRFPSADHAFAIAADRIQPEVNVNELVVYSLGQSERIIAADMELDIREAGIREWSFLVPDDYSIVAVTGANVADYIVATETEQGHRDLKVIFNQDVLGRQLVSLRMEKNLAAANGEWTLPVIQHPAAKAVRGDIGVVGAPGFRISAGTTDLLVEKPLSTFPNAVPNLQQAFRIRQPGWSATMLVEQLERSIQSDVFHLYSLSQGSIYGSSLINYFITGAPTSELVLNIPAEMGNVTVDGQDIRAWRQEGDQVTVTLHQPVMGPYTLLVTFQQKPSAVDGSFTAGQVAPVNVQGDRGFIQVVSPMQVEFKRLQVSNSLLELDPLELPAEFRLLTTAPSLGTWQYTQRPFDLKLQVQWFETGTTATQVVEFSEASSRVSPDGQLVTEVVYYVKSRGQNSLRIQLPDDPVRLWAVSVDGQPVTARKAQDYTLIPLPGGADPNVPMKVSLQLGKPAVEGQDIELLLPIVEAPVLKTQWHVSGGDNQTVIQTGGSVDAARPVVWPNGFDWLFKRGLLPLGLATFLTVLSTLVGWPRPVIADGAEAESDSQQTPTGTVWRTSTPRLFLAVLLSFAALATIAFVGQWAWTQADPPSPLEFNIPVLAAGESVEVQVQNIPSWMVHFSVLGLGLIAGGLVLGLLGRLSQGGTRRILTLIPLGMLTAGTLMQANGAVWFFAMLALGIALLQFLPGFRELISRGWQALTRTRIEPDGDQPVDSETTPEEPRPESGGPMIITSLLIFLMLGLGSWVPPAAAQTTTNVSTSDAIVQQWELTSQQNRLTAKAELTLTGLPGDQFLLLRSPAVLSKFQSEHLQISKREIPEVGLSYVVTIPFPDETETVNPDNAGTEQTNPASDGPPQPNQVGVPRKQPQAKPQRYSAVFEYHLEGIQVGNGIPVLTGQGTLQKIQLSYDQPNWKVICPNAARIRRSEDDGSHTRAQILLQSGATQIVLQPQARDLSSEETQFFVEGAQLYVPGPGVVDGRHRLSIRTSQGKVTQLKINVPDGLTVSAVNGPVTSWQFDADQRQLNVEVDANAEANFDLLVETQRALEPLPTELKVAPLRVEQAGGEVGLMAVAFGSDAQPEKVESEAFSPVNIGDFDSQMLANTGAVVHRAFRYGVDEGDVAIRVIPVSPEVRVYSRQVLSLGDERIVLGVNFSVEISRTGLFQLSFPLPAGLEVESLSGDSLHHWSELVEEEQRKIVMHLNGKTIGNQNFSLTLAGPAPTNVGDWSVPQFEVSEASRQSGELLVRPIPGIRLRAAARQNISELDPRSMGGNQAEGLQGSLAFRLLQKDWNLTLTIERLDPWVAAQVLHEVRLREGQTRSTIVVDLEIQNASLRTLPIELPLTDADEIKTVRASGASVSDFVRTADDSRIWELQFKRRVIGHVQFQIEYERRGERTSDTESLSPAKIEAAKQFAYYYAVRTGGRLELEVGDMPQGWQRLDWNTVPPALRETGNRNAPALTLRAADPTISLDVRMIRHSLADSLKLRVSRGTLTTVLSPNGDQLTAVDITMDVVQRSSLSIQLPEGGQLFSIFVNGESVHSIRKSDQPNGWQFYILPGIDDRTAEVRFVYLVTGDNPKDLALRSPQLNVPLEDVTWKVIAPPGFELTHSDGNLELAGEWNDDHIYDLESYLSKVNVKRNDQAQETAKILQQATELLQQGEQSKARWALNNVANRYGLDAASNEDARVQLENLQTQQAIVGLNTRRQRMFLDNKLGEANVIQNEQLLQAAAANPILQQDQLNFRPQELSQLLAGNTREDNAVLQHIAALLVKHQRTTEPAPQAIVISLPEEGTIYTFTRTVQAAENSPLELKLQFHSEFALQWWQWLILGTILTVMTAGLALNWTHKR